MALEDVSKRLTGTVGLMRVRRPTDKDIARLLVLFEQDRQHPEYYDDGIVPPPWTKKTLKERLSTTPEQLVCVDDSNEVVGWMGGHFGEKTWQIVWLIMDDTVSLKMGPRIFRSLCLVGSVYAYENGKVGVFYLPPPAAGYVKIPWLAQYGSVDGIDTVTGKPKRMRFDVPLKLAIKWFLRDTWEKDYNDPVEVRRG